MLTEEGCRIMALSEAIAVIDACSMRDAGIGGRLILERVRGRLLGQLHGALQDLLS